jgi:hypothetical protein
MALLSDFLKDRSQRTEDRDQKSEKILRAGLMVGAAFQPRAASPKWRQIAAGKPLPQNISFETTYR